MTFILQCATKAILLGKAELLADALLLVETAPVMISVIMLGCAADRIVLMPTEIGLGLLMHLGELLAA